MITIIDRTLTTFNTDGIQSWDLSHFCHLLFTCGVTKIELPAELISQLVTQLEIPSLAEAHVKLSGNRTCFLVPANGEAKPEGWKLEPNLLVEKNLSISKIGGIKNQHIRLVGLEDIITQDYSAIFQELLNSGADTLDLCPSNQNHCATAIALEWILAGGSRVSCGFSGHHDFAPLEEVLMALKLTDPSAFIGDLSVLNELRNLYEKISNRHIPKMKPIIGADIFKVESGIHVDGVLKNPKTYEPFNPQSVGNQREIVLGKHSGSQSVLFKLREQHLPETVTNTLLKQIKKRCTQLGRNISDLELHLLVREVQNDVEAKIYC